MVAHQCLTRRGRNTQMSDNKSYTEKAGEMANNAKDAAMNAANKGADMVKQATEPKSEQEKGALSKFEQVSFFFFFVRK